MPIHRIKEGVPIIYLTEKKTKPAPSEEKLDPVAEENIQALAEAAKISPEAVKEVRAQIQAEGSDMFTPPRIG